MGIYIQYSYRLGCFLAETQCKKTGLMRVLAVGENRAETLTKASARFIILKDKQQNVANKN